MQYLLFTILTVLLPAAEAAQSYYNGIQLNDESASPILSLGTELIVPPKPSNTGTLFLWPGLEPVSNADTNILQTVLTWGPSCAPGTQPADYSTWWVSAQYVSGNLQSSTCQGGSIMAVSPGDTLSISMSKTVTGSWFQVVKDLRTNQSVSFETSAIQSDIVYVLFDIESYQTPLPSNVVFQNTVITFSEPKTNNCNLKDYDPKYTVSTPVLNSDLLSCNIAEIILRTPEDPN